MLTRLFRSIASLALVAGIAIAATPTTAKAVTVDFSTSGTFSGGVGIITGSTGNVLTVSGVTITYNSNTVEVNTPTNTNFGNFFVSGLTSSTASFSNSFVLTINQTAPGNGSAVFPPATVTGTISYNSTGIGSSSAVVQFSTPLTQAIGLVNYTIQNADDMTPGKINLPTNQTSTINGRVSAVPEPATLLSMAIGLPLLGLGAWVRRRRQSC